MSVDVRLGWCVAYGEWYGPSQQSQENTHCMTVSFFVSQSIETVMLEKFHHYYYVNVQFRHMCAYMYTYSPSSSTQGPQRLFKKKNQLN